MTSHGFGHGTRACAVIHALNQRNRSRFMIFSSLPDWFWSENLGEIEHQCIHAETDIGLIQKSPFHHDLDLTAKAWMNFISFSNENFDRCLHRVNQFEPECILCDISPLGLWVGQRLGIPSILIENFTWDWMLEIYAEKNPLFQTISQQLFDLYQRFDLRLQATPFCQKSEYGITVNPIYRHQVETESEVRKQLQVPASTPLIMITTGGICHQYEFLDALYGHSDQNFLLTGDYKSIRCEENVIFLPMRNPFHFQDLVCASDAVIGKVGYGTLVESWASGTPLLGVYRKDFRESFKLREFSKKNMRSEEMTLKEFESGYWLNKTQDLANQKIFSSKPKIENGSLQVAREVNSLLDT